MAGRELPALDGAAVERLTASFTSARSDTVYRTEIWYLPETARVLQRRRDKLGDDGSRKTFRFFEDGVERIRRDPSWWRGESDLPPERWSDVQEDFYPYGAAGAACPRVADPGLLLLAVAAGQPSAADEELTACVFNKQALYRAALRASGSEPVAVDYRVIGAARSEAVTGQATARRILLSVRLAEGAALEPEDFEFFELRGPIEFLVDPEKKLPLAISGEIPGAGRLDFVLKEVTLAP